MDIINLLKKYAELYDKGSNLSLSEQTTYASVKNNPELAEIAAIIDSLPTLNEKYEAIAKYEAQLKTSTASQTNELDQIKNACEKQFGIKLDSIEFKKLQSGKDIIAFFDPSIGRKRLIDYSYARSLVTEFTDVQNGNELYQTDNYEKNATNIAGAEAAANTNRELNMIDVDRFRAEYDEIIKRIPIQEQYKVAMINKLLNQSESRDFKYINLENMVALDKEGNIVEASLTRDNEAVVGEAATYDRDVVSLDNAGNVEYSNKAVVTSLPTAVKEDSITPTDFEIGEDAEFPDDTFTDDQDFRVVVKEEMDKHHILGSVEDEYQKVMSYSENMSKLESDHDNNLIDDNHYSFYKDLSQEYVNSKSLERIKAKTLKYEMKQEAGSIIIFILSFIAMIMCIVALILINR